MGRNRNYPRRIAAAEGLERRALFSAVSVGVATAAGISLQTDKTGVASQLLELVGSSSELNSDAVASASSSGMSFDSSGRVAVDITAKNVTKILPALKKLGFVSTGAVPKDHLVDGYLPIAALSTIDKLKSAGLMGVLPAYGGGTSTGSVDSEGDAALEADRTRAATNDSGAGVTVGVLSDSYNDLGTASADVSSGDLPSNVNVLQDLPSGGTDEGRAMLQIVYDLAPSAGLAFATADISEASFAQNILSLAKPVSSGGAGANVIVDDKYYDDEPYFQDGVIAQAINTVVKTDNVSYFSAAGNNDDNAYQSSGVSFYTATIPAISSSPQLYYNFDPLATADGMQELTLAGGQLMQLGMQWDQPYYTAGGVTTDLNMYLVSQATNTVVASSTMNNIANQTPYQQLNFTNPSTSAANYYLVISKPMGTIPGVIKYVNFAAGANGDIGIDDYDSYGAPTITPHAGTANAFAVAATPSYDQRTTEGFTSEGPSTFLFDSSGNRLSTALVVNKPNASAIDGVSTTFFNPNGAPTGPNGSPLFYGTSAAAAHAAAVGALVLSAHPTWAPAQVYQDLSATADGTIDIPAYCGAGLIDAYAAVVGTQIPATVPVNDGFESGSLGQEWTTYNSGAGRTEVEMGNSPSSGTYQFVEDGNIPYLGNFVFSEAILNLNAAGQSNLQLSFDVKYFNGANGSNQTFNSYPLPTSPFSGHGFYNGVCFSVDGTKWYPIVSLTGSNISTGYQTITFNISGGAAAYGLTLTSDTQIKFQHYDGTSLPAPRGGFAFDNVKVFVPATPLVLPGPSFYLKLDADHLHLDIWNSTTNAGNPGQSVLLSQVSTLSIDGSGSGGVVTVDLGNGNPFPAAGLTLVGSLAQTALLVVGDNNGDSVGVSSSDVSLAGTFGSTFITFSNTSSITFAGGTGSNAVTQVLQPTGAQLVLTGSTATDAVNISAGTLTIPAGTGTTQTIFSLASLSIGSGAKVTVASPASHASRTLLKLSGLTIAGNTSGWLGLLDLTGNDLVLTGGGAAGLAMISSQIKAGLYFNPGPLEGITSSTAAADTRHLTTIGSILNTVNGSTPLYSTFDTAAAGAIDVLVKFTWFGDANLDGKVDGSDYSLIDSAFSNLGKTGWYNGDFNFDGLVNGSDYSLIDNAFNMQGSQL